MQSVLCLPGRGLLSGCFSQDPGLFWLAPLSLLKTDGASRPGEGGWGSGQHCGGELRRPETISQFLCSEIAHVPVMERVIVYLELCRAR